MKTLCTICARGGSKGVPGKNIADVGGKPLIAHTIELALGLPFIDRVILSTDSEDIADVGRQYGAEVPFLRPSEFSNDQVSKLPALKHALNWAREDGFSPELLIDLDPTSPLRLPEDVEACYKLAQSKDTDGVITGYRSTKNPYFNMVEENPEGFVSLSKKGPEGAYASRQAAPTVFAMNASIYVWKTSFFDHCDAVLSGRLKIHEMPEERSIDIDTPTDLEFVRFLLQKNSSQDPS